MEKNEDKKGLIGSAGILALAAILVKFIGLLYKIPMSHLLGDEGMGYFNAAYTIYSTLYLLGTAGVPKAITVLVSQSNAAGEKEKGIKIFRTAAKFFFSIGGIFFITLLIFAHPLSSFIGSPNAYQTVLLIAPCLLFVSLGGVYRGYLGAHGNFSASAVSSVLEGGAKLFLGLGFVFLGEYFSLPLPWISALSVLGITVGTMISTLYLRANIEKTDLKARQKSDFDNKEVIKEILQIALPITLGSLATGASALIDLSTIMRRLEAGGLTAEQATAAYGNYTTLAVPMLQLSASLLSSFAVVLLPRLAASHSAGDREVFRSDVHFGAQASAFVSLPLALILFFFPAQILELLFPKESARLAAPQLRILSVGIIFLSLLFIVNTALEACQRVNLQMLSMLLGVIAKIFVSVLFPENPKIGIAVAPIGTVISYIVSLTFSFFFYGKIDSPLHLCKAYLLPLLNATGASLFAILVFKWMDFVSFLPAKTVITLILFALFYVGSSVFTGVFRINIPKKMSKQPKMTI